MMYGISEQYADDIVTCHFLNDPSDLIYDKCYSFYRRTTHFLFCICPNCCWFNVWLTKIFDLLKLRLKYQSIWGTCEPSSEITK